ncbi:B2 protein-like [Battus philenor]|uniref:B2 protein-like n=1 Tax=Battus philenor TaxID=42288 RepID=UPI0035CFECF6
MLYFAVVLSLLAVAHGSGDGRPVIHLPAIVLDVVKQSVTDCVKEEGVSPAIGEDFFKLKFGSDPDSKKFLYCVSRKTNYADEDGHFNDGMLSLFNGNSLKDEVQKVIEKCNKNKEDTKINTMYKTIDCFHKNTPVLLVE